MDFREIVRNRHSTRAFSDRQIKTETLYEIVEDARRSPSWLNAQETNVYIVAGNAAKAIREEYQERAKQGAIGISDMTTVHRTEWSEKAQHNMESFVHDIEGFLGDELYEFVNAQDNLFHAPAIIYLTLPKDASKWAILDAGVFEGAVVFAATDRGIDSVMAYSFVKYPDIIRKHLEIPASDDIVMGIGLGYAVPDAKINTFRSRRMPLNKMMVMKK